MDSTELEAFCERTLDDVYRYALRLTGGDRARTADLVQDTYVALVRHVGARPGEIVGLPWLITCCRHRFLDGLRGAKRAERTRRRSWIRPVDEDPAAEPSGVVDALRRLGEVERVALVLRHVDGLSVAAVATAIGRSEAATESILRRGRERLRREYLSDEKAGRS